MRFGGAGGVNTLHRRVVSRIERTITGIISSDRAPRVALMKLNEGHFQIAETIATPLVYFPCLIESLYDHLI